MCQIAQRRDGVWRLCHLFNKQTNSAKGEEQFLDNKRLRSVKFAYDIDNIYADEVATRFAILDFGPRGIQIRCQNSSSWNLLGQNLAGRNSHAGNYPRWNSTCRNLLAGIWRI